MEHFFVSADELTERSEVDSCRFALRSPNLVQSFNGVKVPERIRQLAGGSPEVFRWFAGAISRSSQENETTVLYLRGHELSGEPRWPTLFIECQMLATAEQNVPSDRADQPSFEPAEAAHEDDCSSVVGASVNKEGAHSNRSERDDAFES